MSHQTVESLPPRGALKLMWDPLFGTVFWGKLFAANGAWVHGIVAAIAVYAATGSALMVGIVGVVQFTPQILMTPITGRWADSQNPSRQILVGRVLSAIGSGSIAAVLVMAPDIHGTAEAVVVIVGSTVVGIGFSIGGPTLMSILPILIREGELATAMTLNSVPMTAARMAGPAVGAYITAHFGAETGFALAAGMQLFFVALLAIVKLPPQPARPPGSDGRMRAALHYVRHDRRLLVALVAVAAVAFSADPSLTLAPSMAEELGGGTSLIGALTTAFGVGAVVGLVVLALLRGRLSSSWTTCSGVWILGAGLALTAVAPTSETALAGFVLAGAGFTWATTGLGIAIQERAPDALRGRIMALWIVGFLGSRPVAALVFGATADALSVRIAFLIAAAVMLVIALMCRPNTFVRTVPA
jgi:MFS family permease